MSPILGIAVRNSPVLVTQIRLIVRSVRLRRGAGQPENRSCKQKGVGEVVDPLHLDLAKNTGLRTTSLSRPRASATAHRAHRPPITRIETNAVHIAATMREISSVQVRATRKWF